MAEELYSNNSPGNRTFTVAMWILGMIAGGQFLAISWVIMRHQPAGPIFPASGVGSVQGEVTTDKALPVGGEASIVSNIPNVSLPPMPEIFRREGTAGQQLLPTPPLAGLGAGVQSAQSVIPEADPDSHQAYSAHLIGDPAVISLLNAATELRASGNMHAALRTLQTAESKLPDHPRILSEIAGTYSQLGLGDKASSYWEKVYRLGEVRAGAYFDMADMVLKGKQLEPSSSKDSLLSIADVAEVRDPQVTVGERITLRVKIRAKAGTRPRGENMALLVYFYDLVDGKRFLPSTADTSESYISLPYDWLNGESEEIEVTYYQPVFTAEQKRDLGERVYYGYIVELYYQDELQDVVAAPRKLMGLNPSVPPAVNGSSVGPDSSLFPQ